MKTTRSQLRRIILEFLDDAPPNWVQQHWAWRDAAFTRDGDIRYILDIADPGTIKAAKAIGEPYPPGTNVTYVAGRFNPPEELPEKIHVHDSELLDIIKSEGWYQKPPPEGADPQGFWAGTGEWLEDSPEKDWDLPPDDGMEEPLVERVKMKTTKNRLRRIIRESLIRELFGFGGCNEHNLYEEIMYILKMRGTMTTEELVEHFKNDMPKCDEKTLVDLLEELWQKHNYIKFDEATGYWSRP